ncbi:MAG: UDP-N-acetylmuramoyl-tripeptide-D-alanyl-D-alanine ligase [Candidatus Azambacteria bacterium GW2011_GWB2_46_37]|uniref:UDP-N-acetylmuramoyl-tripeptide-D-alanyl-D-alanine ligase n=5 Tax=Candidatus Azamiibacteriota TaxID=1752741 RepID=A0A0G1Q6K7_9BACT|nr:MAG: UDP-N-acetylmuramoyl-tripeptide-D-alanyl-D-alanine ligase [Candidatus Azambacteria bacterium GW2011_GWB1_46_27]KKU37596.1 MAG: UDP-N-acetylmuramoyl-tripeptide-D-alanyl-D-alanine ligase [Candidatus Azambacteria bacterium GW2011_GWF2_46_32]KKU39396.1 MAG: UDP-N-acetylmuramoyl-tripeptide-D-alanyl-D-alanine ligase [Candidatus Azambacteria bacterium GW2011_GWB2_46_37]KKU40624.1 MAG: UDP-N-acetylmuramoyl-tripeptide-D-alanyl-D-alanine ligase [Candidatus Azambacteria bacterium GW2011_GWE2_46_45]
MRRFLQHLLRILAAAVLKKYRPYVIAVTGSVGKTSTKEAIFAVSKSFEPKTRRSFANYNTEIGVPLTILSEKEKIRGFRSWLKVILKGLTLLALRLDYPKILILEMAADRPGDIKYLTEFVKPNVGVVTAIGEIPVHVEFFSGPKAVAREKAVLIESVAPSGRSILNYDDEVVLEMKEKSRARVLTFGFSPEADVKATNYEMRSPASGDQAGISFKLEYGGSFVPARLYDVFGKQAVYAVLAAASCGLVLGMNLVEISEALKNYQSPPGRMRIIKGIKNAWIIDDTYNASPLSTTAALEALRAIEGKRRIAVLGDMREIGKYSEEAHQTIGEKAAEFADLLFTVGEKARFIKSAAIQYGLSEEKIFHFDTQEEAGRALQNAVKQEDIILIKGSRAMKMEKIVEEIMAEPRRADELLVR